MHAPKNAGLPPQIRAGHHSAGETTSRRQAETPGRISQNTDKNRLFHDRASLVFLRLVIVKYFTISSCPNGRRRYQYLKDQRAISHPDKLGDLSSSLEHRMPWVIKQIRTDTFNLEALRCNSQRVDEFSELDIEKAILHEADN
ncbi:hypothetical protein [Agrobacterium tumefaciens]|uniref:hypothetical protein n=1 Tax=Agrobacterium tumefaciens TaxID=358 RepID=UPI001F37D198|nr:hypothetical protein [Agrobacterium tumefaciens]